MEELKIGTDCSGVGSPEEAMKTMGVPYREVFACEKDKYARLTFAANHSPGIFFEDITTRENDGIEQLDIYIAGYPCQAFSNSGKKGGESDPRGTIFYSGLEFMRKNRPRAFVLENVPGMLNVKGVNMLNKWLHLLAKSVNGQVPMFAHPECLGYNCYWAILNTTSFGIPQNRERVFIVGLRDDCDTFSFPMGSRLQTTLDDLLETDVHKKYYLSDSTIKRILSRTKESELIGAREDTYCLRWQNSVDGIVKDDTIPTLRAYPGFDIRKKPVIVTNNNGHLEEHPTVNSLDANYYKGMDNNRQRSLILQRDRGFNKGGIFTDCPPITANSFDHNNLVVQPRIKIVGEVTPGSQGGQIYSPKGIAPAIIAGAKGYALGYILEAKRKILGYSRNRVTGEVENRTERDTALTLHTATGGGGNTDQYVIEPKMEVLGLIDGKDTQGTRVYSLAVAPTLNSSDGGLGVKTGLFLQNSRIRRLTPRECFRLQGYPDTFDISKVSETQQYKQAGNSMTVAVIKAILYNVIAGRK